MICLIVGILVWHWSETVGCGICWLIDQATMRSLVIISIGIITLIFLSALALLVEWLSDILPVKTSSSYAQWFCIGGSNPKWSYSRKVGWFIEIWEWECVIVYWCIRVCIFLELTFLVLLSQIADDVYHCVGERSLYALSDAGQLLFTKKFDFNPCCFLPYSGMWLSLILIFYYRLIESWSSCGHWWLCVLMSWLLDAVKFYV